MDILCGKINIQIIISVWVLQAENHVRKNSSVFQELAQKRDSLRRFIQDASHELRKSVPALMTLIEWLQSERGEDRAR